MTAEVTYRTTNVYHDYIEKLFVTKDQSGILSDIGTCFMAKYWQIIISFSDKLI